MKTRAFAALTPAPGKHDLVASVPYDVVNTAEARALADGKPDSFLHVLRAEINFPDGTDPYSDEIYQASKANFERLQESGSLVRDSERSVYFYRQIMDGHAQTGITLLCHIDDYGNDIIRKHEKTRPVKEDDRTRVVDTLSANPGPVFLTYKDDENLDAYVTNWCATHQPDFDFTDEAGVQHTGWRVPGEASDPVIAAFDRIPLAYVADGHHRSASAHRVGAERRAANPDHTGEEGYNWFLNVLFPASQLKVLPYNRVVRDLNDLSPSELLDQIAESFELERNSGKKSPTAPGELCLFLDNQWHTVKWAPVDSDSPIERLDVSVLQSTLLEPILKIGDPRTDDRIDFVGGIRGTDELEKRVNSGDWAVAFSMYPVTVDQLIDIADAGEIMPPKSTWFEPKLRSGLYIYTLNDE